MNAATAYAERTRLWQWRHNPGQYRVELVNGDGLVLAWLADEADAPRTRDDVREHIYQMMYGERP